MKMENKTNCGNCKSLKGDETAALEIANARHDKTEKRLWIVIILLVLVILITNLFWAWRNSQFETVTTTTEIEADQETDGGGNNYIVGGDMFGEAESQNQENNNDAAA